MIYSAAFPIHDLCAGEPVCDCACACVCVRVCVRLRSNGVLFWFSFFFSFCIGDLEITLSRINDHYHGLSVSFCSEVISTSLTRFSSCMLNTHSLFSVWIFPLSFFHSVSDPFSFIL